MKAFRTKPYVLACMLGALLWPVSACSVLNQDSTYYSVTALEPCDFTLDTRLSPSDAESGHFASRIENLLVRPLNPKCIADAYGSRDLERWAKMGDPVAQYTLAYLIYERSGSVCGRADERLNLLISAAIIDSSVTFEMAGEVKTMKRVPESGLLLADMSYLCFNDDPVKYSGMALEGGMDITYGLVED